MDSLSLPPIHPDGATGPDGAIGASPLLADGLSQPDGLLRELMDKLLPVGAHFSYLLDLRALRYVSLRGNCEAITSYPREFWIGRTPLQVLDETVHADDKQDLLALLRRQYDFVQALPAHHRTGVRTAIDYRFRRADGSHLRVLEQTRVAKVDESGQVALRLGVITDITYLKEEGPCCLAVIAPDGASVKDLFCSSGAKEPLSADGQARERFSRRELELLPLLARGLSSREIAARLSISPHTVTKHRKNMLEKTASRNTLELVRRAAQMGLI